MAKNFLKALFVGALSVVMVACGGDDAGDEGYVNPSSVFGDTRVKSVNGYAMTYDSKGLLTKMVSDDETVTFTYHNVTKADRYISMLVMDGDTTEFRMYLNS